MCLNVEGYFDRKVGKRKCEGGQAFARALCTASVSLALGEQQNSTLCADLEKR